MSHPLTRKWLANCHEDPMTDWLRRSGWLFPRLVGCFLHSAAETVAWHRSAIRLCSMIRQVGHNVGDNNMSQYVAHKSIAWLGCIIQCFLIKVIRLSRLDLYHGDLLFAILCYTIYTNLFNMFCGFYCFSESGANGLGLRMANAKGLSGMWNQWSNPWQSVATDGEHDADSAFG